MGSAGEVRKAGEVPRKWRKRICGVGAGAAGGVVGGDGAEGLKGVGMLDDELDGADAGERGDGAAGNDGERRRERRDGDEAEIGAAGEKFVGAARGQGVVELVALGERRRRAEGARSPT